MTSEIKPVKSWLLFVGLCVVRMFQGFGTQGLMPLGAVGMFGCVDGSTATWCNTEHAGLRVYGVGGKCVWQLWMVSEYCLPLMGRVEVGSCSSLVRRGLAVPLGQMEGVCRVVISFTQCDGWKISNTDQNGCWVTEWRWLLFHWGCSSVLRSL